MTHHYQPLRGADGYPGAHLPPEHAEQIRRLQVPADELTIDDIVLHSVSVSGR